MPGIGGNETTGRLVTLQEELPGDIDGILDSVRRVILLGEVQSIVIRNGEPLTYQRFVRPGEEVKPGESTASFAELTPYDVVRQIRMEEYNNEHGGSNPSEVLLRMVVYMGFDGWVLTHVLTGEKTKFWDWLGIPSIVSRKLPQFLGARIERETKLPEDIFILCGATTRNATIAEIGFALKGNIV